jgi:hypothetical protein
MEMGWLSSLVTTKKTGRNPCSPNFDGEYLGLLGSVVGVGGDGDFFVGMIVVRGIRFGGLGRGLHEVFRRQRQWRPRLQPQERERLLRFPRELHGPIIERLQTYSFAAGSALMA